MNEVELNERIIITLERLTKEDDNQSLPIYCETLINMISDYNSKGKLLKGIKRTAQHYQCSVQNIQNLVNKKAIPNYKIGRTRYFYTGEIEEALRVDSVIKVEEKRVCYGNN